jgi:nicotinate-nucleotide pyrophosphorylase (carboxylating)
MYASVGCACEKKMRSYDLAGMIRRALEEDIGAGDVTTMAILPAKVCLSGEIVSKEEGVVAGLDVAREVFVAVDPEIVVSLCVGDGDLVSDGTILATVTGPGAAILSAERVALNFLQRMSGIATMTRRFVNAVEGTRAVILDTRKTAPGLRAVDKLAVKLGGGRNHRFGLYDMVLIKDNHIAAAGSITEAMNRVRAVADQELAIEVEVTSLVQFGEALAARPNRILLDNMALEDMAQAVVLAAGEVELEASGKVTLDNVAQIAATGVDFISVGSLTHSVRALDISLEITGSS